MTLSFFTNLIIHHQTPLADEFYEILGNKYTFIATTPLPKSMKDSGYADFSNKPYLLKAYESKENYLKAMELGLDSDVVIIGDAPEIFIKERIRLNKLTFRYSERLFKKIDYHLLSPRAWFSWFNNHTKYRNKNLYMLCASAYTSNDVSKIYAYPNKCYKWGYFTQVEKLDVIKVIEEKRQQCFKILWVSRFLSLKHPELPIKLASVLKNKGYSFQISMVGTGGLQEEMKSMVSSLNLEDCVTFKGNMPNEDIICHMRKSNAFLFTSDRNEGWGAVLNEAMSNCCTVIASDLIGSVPYLINNEKNGLIFRSENLISLTTQVEKLLNNRALCEEMAMNAYNSMNEIWNPRHAAKYFLELSSSLLEGKPLDFPVGPCSAAHKLRKRVIL